MKSTIKWGTLLVLLMAGAAGGAWLAGQILFWWFGFDRPVGLGTWFSYVRVLDDPRYAVHANKIKLSGVAGFAVPLLAWLGMAWLMFRPAQRSTHGDARFAAHGELSKAGLLTNDPTGVLIGRNGGTYLRDKGQRFIMLAAPTRSGKGVGVVIPVLLDYQESVVVLDIKQENFDLTSGYRKSIGQEVFVFNPFAENGRTHRWNPFRYVSTEPARRVGDLRSIAQMLYSEGDGSGNQQFFTDHARNVFLALSLYLFEAHEFSKGFKHAAPYPTFGGLYRKAAGQGEDLKKYLAALAAENHLSEACKTAFAGFLSQAEETFSSIMGTFNAPLTAWADPILDAATSADDFLLTDVRKKKMTVYLCVSPNKLKQAALIFNLFFSQLINENTKALPSQDKDLKHQCLLLMDEFTSIGAVDIIAHAVSYMAGYNLRLLPIIQSMAQLDATYGKERARTLITNHATQIVYAPREQQDANDYSEMLGYTTVRRRQRTVGKDVSHTEVEERRALMLPQELKAIGPDKEILFIEGMAYPAMVDKIRYYQEGMFKKRLLPAVDIPELRLSQSDF
ncbi:MAG: type IV secretory system conjugative DNA transfer family protein [Pseudomonadota bacterium]|nr:type IV secretory system conjugative DNA transfer family protein [Pseudomonadota bacterium]